MSAMIWLPILILVVISDKVVWSQDNDIVEIRPLEEVAPILSCQFASLQCNYRTGCSKAMQSYLIECHDLVSNRSQVCTENCKNTLIGLTSTPQGKALMSCDCGKDMECQKSKHAINTYCRDSVLKADDAILSCTEARWICIADAECGKALEYYNLYCKSMFRGRRCSRRCQNSIEILRRQRQSAKLEACECSENEYIEEFKCSDVKRNMKELCTTEKDQDGEDEEGLIEKEDNQLDPREPLHDNALDEDTQRSSASFIDTAAVIIPIVQSVLISDVFGTMQ